MGLISALTIVVLCLVTIALVEMFGLLGLGAGFVLCGALVSALKWIDKRYFDPLAAYKAEREVIDRPTSKKSSS